MKKKTRIYLPSEEFPYEDFNEINHNVFGWKLKYPEKYYVGNIRMIDYPDAEVLGFCDPRVEGVTLGLSSTQIYSHKEYMDVLAHEMVHLYQIQVLKREPDHGVTFKAWREKCERFGYIL